MTVPGALLAAVLAATLVFPMGADAKTPRSAAAKAEFKRAHPCPSTGKSRGACPGYVVDHIQPLCAGGPDRPDNMQWQTVSDAKAKDREERRLCRAKR
jgi:hypothetical protein